MWSRLAVVPLAVLPMCLPLRAVDRAVTPAASPWRLVYVSHFPVAAPLGSFSGCNASTHTCTGLPKVPRAHWWAYPVGWPDTATEMHERVGGYYSPSTAVWIAGGVMNIRLWRDTGSVHSAALLPKATMARTYGKYVETFRVLNPILGYKSAHMLHAVRTPTDGSAYEIDFPEAGWGLPFSAFVHYANHRPWFPSGVKFDRRWHTSVIEWTPHRLSFYCDGRLLGSIDRNVSDVPMRWIIQNETQMNGTAYPPEHSSSTMQIKYVAYYAWSG
jgi:hypothetical protein